MTVTVPQRPPAELIALVRRVESGDRDALRVLHADLLGSASDRARRTLSRDADVREVVDATFVEVFWMSRFHAASDLDVLAWVLDIVVRRATECLLTPPCHDDEGSRLALAWLLGPAHTRVGPAHTRGCGWR